MEVIILAGGMGTRLQSEVPGLPKCLAPVAGKPFLHYQIRYLLNQKIDTFIFSLGYLHEKVIDYLDRAWPSLEKVYVVEEKPLYTGGGIKLACGSVKEENVFICNGDTLFSMNALSMLDFHIEHSSHCTLALKKMHRFDRYGTVFVNENKQIIQFKEKQWQEEGYINGGMYCLHVPTFIEIPFEEKFSFEKDYLALYYPKTKMMGFIDDSYFLDIGIPQDYQQAQTDFLNF